MAGIVAVLVVVTVSVVITRIGAIALEATGVSADLARFQARSAFTGVGYTTSEAENITGHPARRRIVLVLMLLGNAGIVSIIASLVIGLSDAPRDEAVTRIAVLVAGLALLWVITSTDQFDRFVRTSVRRVMRRWTDVEVRDYVQLLDVTGDYAVRDVPVDQGDWLEEAERRAAGGS